ncbi:MAG: hypothetical protein ACJAYU_002402 [Bradymonadia bacterium]
MKRPIGLAVAVLLASCGGPDVVDEEPVIEPEIESIRAEFGSPDNLSGTWARSVVTSAESSAPIVGRVGTTNTRIFLDHVVQQDGSIQVESLLCDMSVETSTNMASTVIPSAFISAVGRTTWRATIDAGRLHSPMTYTTMGLSEVSPEDSLPESGDDPRVLDPDGDGQPGMTIQVTGLAGGEMYFVQRSWRELESTRVTGTTIDGTVSWDATRVVLGATSRSLRNARPAVPTESPAENYFRMTRIADQSTCVEVAAQGPSLFSR